MDQFSYNDLHLIKNGTPWIPIMGEIHYSRLRREDWYSELLKMKAGGVDIVATYIIWIHHEEEEGRFEFSGNNDLNHFVSLCKKAGLYLFLRIGPWCHAEVRNGGFPDWLLTKPFQTRTNDEGYIKAVGKFYHTIYSQVKEHLYLEDGPIIGVQIENEYGHAGGLTGSQGQLHMEKLTEIARKTGFDVPYYTATGWGGACTGGLLPVFGGYCDAPWTEGIESLGPNTNFSFSNERNDTLIASDYSSNQQNKSDNIEKDFPYLTAELGSGIQVTDHRRPLISGTDIETMALVKLGSGANLLGYYMYHGGTNPVGKWSSFQESTATGSPNDYAVYSYDFQAPLGEFGQVRESYHHLRRIHTQLTLFGKQIATMKTVIINKRFSLRYKISGKSISGFLFINNYQRLYRLQDIEACGLSVRIESFDLVFSVPIIKTGEYGMLPIYGELDDLTETALEPASVMPLFLDSEKLWGYQPFSHCNSPVSDRFWEGFFGILKSDAGKIKRVFILPESTARSLYPINLNGKEFFIIHKGGILSENKTLTFTSNKPVIEVAFHPKPDFLPYHTTLDKNGFYTCTLGSDTDLPAKVDVKIAEIMSEKPEKCKKFSITMDYGIQDFTSIENILLEMEFSGDKAEISIKDKLVHDFLYTGQTYEFGLKQYDYPEEIILEITALNKNKEVYLEKIPRFTDSKALGLGKVNGVIIHRVAAI